MTQYPPRHLSGMLQVSGSTIRRWSDTFAAHLSPSATAAPRRYTANDVVVLRRVKALSDSGMRIAEIDALLAQPEPLPTEPPTERTETPTAALQTFTALTDTLAAQQATQQQIAATLAGLADVATLAAQIAELRERVARLEGAAHRHPWAVPTKPVE